MQPLIVKTFEKKGAPPPILNTLPAQTEEAYKVFSAMQTTSPTLLYRTPLLHSVPFSTPLTNLYIKLESEQQTNSFKPRAILNVLRKQVNPPYIGASSGNHALALVHILSHRNISGKVFLPITVEPVKLARLQTATTGTNVEIVIQGVDILESELLADQYAKDHNATYISPYNNLNVIAGVGTIAPEILDTLSTLQQPRPNCAIYATVGGGALISGIAAYLAHVQPNFWRVVACQAKNSPIMYDSVAEGRVVTSHMDPTLSDGSAGPIESDAITFPLCAALVDAWALVTEEEISHAIREIFVQHGKVIEGAAGVALAGYWRDTAWREENACDTAVVVVCGGNVGPETFLEVVRG